MEITENDENDEVSIPPPSNCQNFQGIWGIWATRGKFGKLRKTPGNSVEFSSHSYKQGVECWISGNHKNHGNDHRNPSANYELRQSSQGACACSSLVRPRTCLRIIHLSFWSAGTSNSQIIGIDPKVGFDAFSPTFAPEDPLFTHF